MVRPLAAKYDRTYRQFAFNYRRPLQIQWGFVHLNKAMPPSRYISVPSASSLHGVDPNKSTIVMGLNSIFHGAGCATAHGFPQLAFAKNYGNQLTCAE